MRQGICIALALTAIIGHMSCHAAPPSAPAPPDASTAADEVDYSYHIAPEGDGKRFVYLAYDVLADRFVIRAITSSPIPASTSKRLPVMELLVVSADGHQIQPLYRNFEYKYRRDPNDLIDTPVRRIVTRFECSSADAAKAHQNVHDVNQGVITEPCLSRFTKPNDPSWMATPGDRASVVLNVDAIKTAIAQTDLMARLSEFTGTDIEVSSEATPASSQSAWLLHWNDGTRAVFKPTQWQIAGSLSPTGGELLWRQKSMFSQDAYQPAGELRKVLFATSVDHLCTRYSYQRRDESTQSFTDCDGLSPLFVTTSAGMKQVECVFGEYFALDARNDARFALDERICLGGRDDGRRGGQPGALPRHLTEIDILTSDEMVALDPGLAKARHVERNR